MGWLLGIILLVFVGTSCVGLGNWHSRDGGSSLVPNDVAIRKNVLVPGSTTADTFLRGGSAVRCCNSYSLSISAYHCTAASTTSGGTGTLQPPATCGYVGCESTASVTGPPIFQGRLVSGRFSSSTVRTQTANGDRPTCNVFSGT